MICAANHNRGVSCRIQSDNKDPGWYVTIRSKLHCCKKNFKFPYLASSALTQSSYTCQCFLWSNIHEVQQENACIDKSQTNLHLRGLLCSEKCIPHLTSAPFLMIEKTAFWPVCVTWWIQRFQYSSTPEWLHSSCSAFPASLVSHCMNIPWKLGLCGVFSKQLATFLHLWNCVVCICTSFLYLAVMTVQYLHWVSVFLGNYLHW